MKLIILTYGDPGGISGEIIIKTIYYLNKNKNAFFSNYKILIIGSLQSFFKNYTCLSSDTLFSNLSDNPSSSIENDFLFSILNYTLFITKLEEIIKIDFKKIKNKNIFFYDPIFEIAYYLSFFPNPIIDFNNINENFNNLEKVLNNIFSLNYFSNSKSINNFKKSLLYKKLKNYQKINILKFIRNKDLNVDYKKISVKNGLFSEIYLYISYILTSLLKHSIDSISILTMPVNKKSISFIKKDFIGQTEYLQKLFFNKNKLKVNMIFYSDYFSILLVTTHVPIFKLKKYINKKKFEISLINSINYFKNIYGNNGKIAVIALNPHASDEGILGKEEKWIKEIIEKVNKINLNKIKIEGPFPADAIFSRYYDISDIKMFISFYHDQGLIPFKMIAKDGGVNISFGLPFLRVSPDHGVAFDKTFKNIANINSTLKCFEIIEKFNNN
jgi:4-hydroxythreonine-4-phosphate dehydrogenase